MRRKIINPYTVWFVVILIFSSLFFLWNLSGMKSESMYLIFPKLKRDYINYFDYKDKHVDQSIGEVYANYKELPVSEMIAIDMLVHYGTFIRVPDKYIKSYLAATNQKFDNDVWYEFLLEVEMQSDKLYERYKHIIVEDKAYLYGTFAFIFLLLTYVSISLERIKKLKQGIPED
ncbi:hypothetical protein E0485_04180 [Paenibacillus albiflavus]|uniref:Uncharacterized protein n=1 Tax=Paenibacillus albiflavus TaxID=2545760 RepID=A0A4R4ENG0_9BACL|nr:hypothetical protein [Paenibacillus albiflavus]TCZ80061.1 hypothetical protein E0485_04180 [Paenibacillus albiflavus]